MNREVAQRGLYRRAGAACPPDTEAWLRRCGAGVTVTIAELLFSAPHCAVDPADPDLIHAARLQDIFPVTGSSTTVTAPCGASGLKVLASDGHPVAWPPAVRGLAPARRCRECWVATGRKRPASRKRP